MAGSIKGIIVEIGGDTSGLQKALSKVNSATSSLSRELRGINSLLKLDPKNTDLLSQRQIVLNQEIGKTQEKLKTLQEIQGKADKTLAEGGKISQENYRALQREIINTENKLKKLKLEASSWTQAGRKIEEIGKKIQSVGNKVDSLGNKLTTRVTAPLVALGVVGVKSASEQEAAMQQVDLIYKEASKSIKDFAENTAVSYNMSTKEAYKYSQIYGNLIQSITDDEKENAQYTQELLKASSVIASATGRTMEDVMDRIRSGLLGNTEAIEDLGVNVNVSLLESTDAFKKFAGDKSWNKLDFQTQQQIRLFGILEQTTKKYGKEVNKNTASNIQKLTAKFNNLTSKLNKNLLPIANKLIDKADKFIDKLNNLNDEEAENIIKIGLMVAAAGPLVKIIGKVISVTGSATKGIGIFSQAIGVLKTGAESSDKAVNILAKGIGALTSPVGIAALGITTAVSSAIIAIKQAEKNGKEAFSKIGSSANNFTNGIEEATSHLSNFNSTLFVSSEEQQKLKTDMADIQKGITEVCKKASDERRDYTKEEVAQLDKYFKKLRELKNKEIQIQSEIGKAITQQATTNAEKFQGSLEEYKIQSQEWIKTATEQKDTTVALIEQGTIEEVALLNQRYTTEKERQSDAYQEEYNTIMQQKQIKIDMANDEVAKVSEIYANGYLERNKQNDGFYESMQDYLSKIESEQNRHNERIENLSNTEQTIWNDVNGAIRSEKYKHKEEMKKISDEMYKNMSEEQKEELGIWIAQVAQTELYGGKISDETQNIVDSIIESYDSMPKDTKEAMKNAMQPMLEEMEKKEPSLFAKASGIADGILARLKKSFDIHSPSRQTRKIFKNVMKGSELGLEDEETRLYKQVDTISNNLLKKFRDFAKMEMSLGQINSKVIDSTKTVFTTPNINIYAQDELTPSKINSIVDTVNRRLGSQY